MDAFLSTRHVDAGEDWTHACKKTGTRYLVCGIDLPALRRLEAEYLADGVDSPLVARQPTVVEKVGDFLLAHTRHVECRKGVTRSALYAAYQKAMGDWTSTSNSVSRAVLAAGYESYITHGTRHYVNLELK